MVEDILISTYLNEEIIIRYECPIELVSDQDYHFIKGTIQLLTTKFMIHHRKSTLYYPQGKGQAESTNKVTKAMLIKIVNTN